MICFQHLRFIATGLSSRTTEKAWASYVVRIGPKLSKANY